MTYLDTVSWATSRYSCTVKTCVPLLHGWHNAVQGDLKCFWIPHHLKPVPPAVKVYIFPFMIRFMREVLEVRLIGAVHC